MKHLIAILAHKNPKHLSLLIRECLKRNYYIIIHLDAKVRDEMMAADSMIASHTIASAISVQRAHFSIVEATISLLKEAENIEYDYFHLISGEDYITKSIEEFDSFFNENNGKNFINHLSMPVEGGDDDYQRSPIFEKYSIYRDCVPAKNYRHWTIDGGRGFINRYYPSPDSWLGKLIDRVSVSYRLRKLIAAIFSRKVPDVNIYTGSAWFSVTGEMTAYWLQQWNTDTVFRDFFKNSLFPDEIYLQTLAANSPLSTTLINSDLRYISWEKPINHGPSVLGMEHLEDIQKSNGFFARKMDVSDQSLKNAIQEKLYKC